MSAKILVSAATVSLAAVLANGNAARAAEECGPPVAGVEVRCAPPGYDAAADGNVFYRPGPGAGDFSLRLEHGLSVAYDRGIADDELRLGDFDPGGLYRHGAVVAVPEDAARSGGLAVSSSADVTATGEAARGYLVGRIGGPGGVRLDLEGGSVAVAGARASGVSGFHAGEGDIAAALRGVDVSAAGRSAFGLQFRHFGVGDVVLDVEGGSLRAEGARVTGVLASQQGEAGRVEADLRDAAVAVAGDGAAGVWVQHRGAGDVALDVSGGMVEAGGGDGVFGVVALHRGDGSVLARLRDAAVSVAGDGARGLNLENAGVGDVGLSLDGVRVDAEGEGAAGAFVAHRGGGGLTADLRDAAVSVAGAGARGVELVHHGSGDVRLSLDGVSVDAEGEDAYGAFVWNGDGGGLMTAGLLRDAVVSVAGADARGVELVHHSSGDVVLDVDGGKVDARGESSIGMLASHSGDSGGLTADLRDAAVSATGAGARGLTFQHFGGGEMDVRLRDVSVTAGGAAAIGLGLNRAGVGSTRVRVDGGAVRAEGPGGIGVDVGGVDPETGEVVDAAEIGEDGYRRQEVHVDGQVRGGADDGSDRASGIRLGGGGRVAIGPRGSVGAASGVAILARGDGARLHVGMELDGRRPQDAIDGTIVNDGGRTTIAVNGTTLHDGETGATGLRAPNGARDVTLAASGTVAGRLFTAADFVTGPYTPRAAVYEALPGFLQRLDGRATQGERLRRAGSPAWARVSGGRGSYGPKRASAGASWDFDRFAVEAGVDFGLSDAGDVAGSASLRHVRGSADISAPTGGGKIEAEGIGVSLGAAWRIDAGYYMDGRVSLTRYEVDLRASGRGPLKEGANATVLASRVEAGRRLALGETAHLTPRVWLARADVSLDGFRDAVGSRVSLGEAGRTDAGIGIVAGSARDWGGGTLSLRGDLGVERALGGAETVVDVSGEHLRSEAAGTRMVLGLGGTYRRDGYSLGGAVSSSGAGSDDSAWTASLRFAMRF